MDFDKFANGSHHDAPRPRSIKPIETFPYLFYRSRPGIWNRKDFSYGFSKEVSAEAFKGLIAQLPIVIEAEE